MKNLILLLVVLVTLSCKKQYGGAQVKGQVIETGTNLPISGAQIALHYWVNNTTNISIIQTQTDANGNYSIAFQRQEGYTYELHINDANHYIVDGSGNYVNGLDDTKNFTLPPFAYLKLRIIKTTSYQWLSQNIDINYHDFYGFYITQNNPFDTIIPTVMRMKGNSANNIDYQLDYPTTGSVVFDSSKTSYNTLFIKKGDTASYVLQYK